MQPGFPYMQQPVNVAPHSQSFFEDVNKFWRSGPPVGSEQSNFTGPTVEVKSAEPASAAVPAKAPSPRPHSSVPFQRVAAPAAYASVPEVTVPRRSWSYAPLGGSPSVAPSLAPFGVAQPPAYGIGGGFYGGQPFGFQSGFP